MNIKKILKPAMLIVVSLTLISSLTACGETQTKTTKKISTSEQKKDSDKKANKESAYSKIKIGMINIGAHTETSGYTFAHVKGVQAMLSNLSMKENQVVYKDNIPEKDPQVEKAIQECIDEGCNTIFATSWGYANAIQKLAKKYPDVKFAHASGNLSNGSNFIHYFGRIYQARYLSGIAAGLKTKTNKIGYVTAWAKDNAECIGGIDAFAIGVASVNPRAKIYVRATNTWFDAAKEKQAAQYLIKAGCDVISQHCDTSEPQVAAQNAGVWGIGYNSDMSKEAPKATLLSVVWNWSAFYTSAVQDIAENTWSGKNYFGGIKDGMVAITDLASFNAPSAQSKIDAAKQKIESGSWDVFTGILPTNTGKTIGVASKSLADDTIQFKINWFYKNVVVTK